MLPPESITPEVKPELTVQEAKATVEKSGELQAAEFLIGALPVFRNRLQGETITGVQAKRILLALVEAPLGNEEPSFTTSAAAGLYELGLQITNAKFIMFHMGMTKPQQEEKKEEKENG